MVQRQQQQPLNDFENLNSATNVLNDEVKKEKQQKLLNEKQMLLSSSSSFPSPSSFNFEQNKTLNENFENIQLNNSTNQQPKFLSIRQIKNGENEIGGSGGYFVEEEEEGISNYCGKINFNLILQNLIVNLFFIVYIFF
uniref:Uncharacterized protein n=1 Tax=Meloidogyne enterolobii TaxID=390850 RepID=A0A6V7UTC0_MELEN|nr:unnamed protein product [Meloidogyne enterolobii]